MPPRKKQRFPQTLSDLVRRIYPAPDQLHEVQIFGWWSRSLPPRIASRARPVRLERGTLLVHVESAAWAQELSFQADDLLRRIQAFAPRAGVRELRFRVGPLPEVPLRVDAEAKRKTPEPLPVVAMPEELGRALAHVHDDEVRAAVARAASIGLRQEAAEAELSAAAKRRGRE